MAEIETAQSNELYGAQAFGCKQELKRYLTLFNLFVYGLFFINPMAPMLRSCCSPPSATC